MAANFLQSVTSGVNAECPGGIVGMEPISQVFSYERQFSKLRLGQVDNIVDESLYESDNDGGGVGNAGAEKGFGASDGSVGPGIKVLLSTRFSLIYHLS